MGSCVFCAIAAKEVKSKIVYEDEQAVAFGDINPKAPVHVLIIPRKHISSLNEMAHGDEQLVGHLLSVARTIAADQGIGRDGYRIVINCGPDGGQTVDHLHVHLLGGRVMTWPPG